MKRSILLFPSFQNLSIIQDIRNRFDPLSKYISPHITLVFPFESDMNREELTSHLHKALTGIKRFSIMLKDITGDKDGYMLLNVKKGNDQIIEIHDRLYSGLLKRFLTRRLTYCPHLTVGRLFDKTSFDQAVMDLANVSESFEALIDTVYVERIGEDDTSNIECSFPLE